MNKLMSVEAAINKITDGSSIMIGGFIGLGRPETLIDALVASGAQNLTVISNDTDFQGQGVGRLIASGQVAKAIVSHIGTNPETGLRLGKGELTVDLVPQGTLVERIRAQGAGLGGVLTPTGIGTIVEDGKDMIQVEGKSYLLETALGGDVALIKAYKADSSGNLVFRRAGRNFNPVMAMAAKYVIAEVEEYVEIGEIHPDDVMLPGLLIDAIVKGISNE
ncbi:MAG: 3-oxoacid CoA-transferase subunit A [Peptococcaceae bacterium]|nr:3-oxoacid CoA-transferase subunit A [Peptococcaceae bacterium]